MNTIYFRAAAAIGLYGNEKANDGVENFNSAVEDINATLSDALQTVSICII